MEEIKKELEKADVKMVGAIDHTKDSFSKIRAGKATPSILDGVRVEYYGNLVPISQVASINNVDARTLVIKPWDKSMIVAIETGIIKSHLEFTPKTDGEVIHINIPPLTEESRSKLMKNVKQEAEKGKVSIRNIRKDSKDNLKKIKNVSEDLIRDAESDLQDKTDKFIKDIDNLLSSKEKDIMEL